MIKKNAGVTIIELGWDDLLGTYHIYLSAYNEVKKNPDFNDVIGKTKVPLTEHIDAFAKVFKEVMNKETVFCIAKMKNEAIGQCYVRQYGGPGVETSHVGVLRIFIKKEARGKGVGKKLINAVITRCRGKFDLLELDVVSKNDPAIGLYKKLGFKTWGVAPSFFKRNGKYKSLEHMYLKLK